MSKNFIDRFYEEDNKDHFWSLNKKIGACLVVLFLAVVMVNTTGCTKGDETADVATDSLVNVPAPQAGEQPGAVNVDNNGENAAIAPDDDAASAKTEDNSSMVAMSIVDMGRSDPFLPGSEAAAAKPKSKPKPPKYAKFLTPPPESIVVDTTVTNVMTTKVSGIMYDKFNPSAILNITGSDYLVRTGDVINGYKILSIGKDTVTVQYGANVYKASVGEIFTAQGINFNTISNLQNKFGSKRN